MARLLLPVSGFTASYFQYFSSDGTQGCRGYHQRLLVVRRAPSMYPRTEDDNQNVQQFAEVFRALSLSLSLSLSLTHTHTLSLSHTHSLSHAHTLSLTHTLSHSLSLSLSFTLSPCRYVFVASAPPPSCAREKHVLHISIFIPLMWHRSTQGSCYFEPNRAFRLRAHSLPSTGMFHATALMSHV